MSKDSFRPKKWSTQTVKLPENEAIPRTPEQYRVLGIQMNGDFEFGVSAVPEEDWSIDEFPQTVHDVLSDMAADTIDMSRVRAETTQETWPLVGMLTLSRENGDTVKVDIEWLPSYLPTPADETEEETSRKGRQTLTLINSVGPCSCHSPYRRGVSTAASEITGHVAYPRYSYPTTDPAHPQNGGEVNHSTMTAAANAD